MFLFIKKFLKMIAEPHLLGGPNFAETNVCSALASSDQSKIPTLVAVDSLVFFLVLPIDDIVLGVSTNIV